MCTALFCLLTSTAILVHMSTVVRRGCSREVENQNGHIVHSLENSYLDEVIVIEENYFINRSRAASYKPLRKKGKVAIHKNKQCFNSYFIDE